MKIHSTLLALVVAAIAASPLLVVEAFPSGAGGCGGSGSVGGKHVSPGIPTPNNLEVMTLSELNLEVQAQYGVTSPFSLHSGTTQMTAFRTYRVAVEPKSNSDNPTKFRGFLFRIRCGQLDTTSYIEVMDSKSQIASACTAMSHGGVTHINNNEKTLAEASLTIESGNQDNQCGLEVSIVVENREISLLGGSPIWSSVYAYEVFALDIVGGLLGDTEPVSTDPNSTQTQAPTQSPTTSGASYSTMASGLGAASALLALALAL